MRTGRFFAALIVAFFGLIAVLAQPTDLTPTPAPTLTPAVATITPIHYE